MNQHRRGIGQAKLATAPGQRRKRRAKQRGHCAANISHPEKQERPSRRHSQGSYEAFRIGSIEGQNSRRDAKRYPKGRTHPKYRNRFAVHWLSSELLFTMESQRCSGISVVTRTIMRFRAILLNKATLLR